MSSVSFAGPQALALVVGCDGHFYNAARIIKCYPVFAETAKHDAAGNTAGVYVFTTPVRADLISVHNLTFGEETLTDEEITQVARHLTERLSDSEPANWPIHMSEIIADVRGGSGRVNPSRLRSALENLTVAAERLIDCIEWGQNSDAALYAREARALLAELDGETDGGTDG